MLNNKKAIQKKDNKDREKKDREKKENQKLKQENQKLKKQISRLNKQISRLDLDNFGNIREAVEAQQREDIDFGLKTKQIDVKFKWVCYKCGDDYLRIAIISRPDGDFYFRKCPNCENKTKLKPFTEKVEQIT